METRMLKSSSLVSTAIKSVTTLFIDCTSDESEYLDKLCINYLMMLISSFDILLICIIRIQDN